MRLFYKLTISIFFLISVLPFDGNGQGQGIDMLGGKSEVVIPFEYIQGHMVVEVILHRFLPIKCIFDTGAQHSVLFDKNFMRIFNLESERTIAITGADLTKPLYADIFRGIDIEVFGSSHVKRDLLVLPEDILNLEQVMGIKIHGIIGAEYWRNLVVKIDYQNFKITFYNPNKFKAKELEKFTQVESILQENKFYIQTLSKINRADTAKTLKILLDTGASLSLLLNTDTDTLLKVPPRAVSSVLGQGITGPIMGFIGKVHETNLGDFKMKNHLTFFQDDEFTILDTARDQRNGLIGNQIISKFDVILDYFHGNLYLKKNKAFDDPIKFDLSGLTIYAYGPKLNQFLIKSIIKGSPGDTAGFQINDEILKIGWWSAWRYSLESLTNKFTSKEGKKIKLKIRRGETILTKTFVLRDYLAEE